MNWTYSGDPTSSTRDELRFLIGDTDEADPQLQDLEIEYLLTQRASTTLAAVFAAETLQSRYARLVDKTVGDLSLKYSQRGEQYAKLAEKLRAQAALSSSFAAPYAGGIRISDKLIDETDSDRAAPAFKRGLQDYQQSRDSTQDDRPR